MLKPLAESIEEHEKILASIGRNLANCPSSVAMLSMILSAVMYMDVLYFRFASIN